MRAHTHMCTHTPAQACTLLHKHAHTYAHTRTAALEEGVHCDKQEGQSHMSADSRRKLEQDKVPSTTAKTQVREGRMQNSTARVKAV